MFPQPRCYSVNCEETDTESDSSLKGLDRQVDLNQTQIKSQDRNMKNYVPIPLQLTASATSVGLGGGEGKSWGRR